jgi:hypothetical protein
MPLGTDAELDYMLEDAGNAVVFSRGASVLATTSGLLDRKQLLGQDIEGLSPVGRSVTLTIREGTHGTATINDTATVTGIAFTIRDLGEPQADGTRVLTLAGG